MQVKQLVISKAVQTIRTEWAKSDAKRDAGLTIPDGMVRYTDLSYGPYGEWNLLDIYHMEDVPGCRPAIISVHGGAWVYGDKELYQYYCMELAKRGFTVVNFNYRLAPENLYPAPLEDMNNVLCFLKEHGREYQVDPENLFMVGDSAGAQLLSQYLTIYSNPEYASLFTFTPPEVRIRAAALNCGLYDAKKCAENGLDEPFIEYMGKEIMKKILAGDRAPESLNTIKYMTSDYPPCFVMTSYHDFLKSNAEPMYRHLQNLGVPCKYKLYGSKEQKEIAHVFHVDCKLEEAKVCNDEECDFFRNYISLKLGEENTEAVNTLEKVGLILTENDGKPTEITLTIDNQSGKDLSYGRDYWLELEKDGRWYQVLPWSEVAITLELLWVPAGGKDTQRIVWEPFYGALPMGHYRIIKPVTDDRQRYLLAGAFTVN